MDARIVSVSLSATHSFSKAVREEIRLLAGLGVEGDAHCGATVRHRYRVRQDPTAANLTQVHLLQSELFAALAARGLEVAPGEMGENVTTAGIDLLQLGRRDRLHLGKGAIVEITGLREPCRQLDGLRAGLMKACVSREAVRLVRKAGVMGVVVAGGIVRVGDGMVVEAAEGGFEALSPV